MKYDLWSKPFDWSSENKKILTTISCLFSKFQQTKRLQVDPFENKLKIRCTFQGCKIRYEARIASETANSLPDYLKALNIEHQHFYTELGASKNHNFIYFPGSMSTILCNACFSQTPFPLSSWLKHSCPSNNWSASLGNPNTLSWKSSAWVLLIEYDSDLWKFLNTLGQPYVTYDEIANGFIVSDSCVSQVLAACTASELQHFKHYPKAKIHQNPNRVLTNSPRAAHANAILNAIPTAYLPKVKRAIQQVIHPDRDPDNTDFLTKAFQEFEASWAKWEGGK